MDSKVKLGISFVIILAVIVSSNSSINWSFLSGQDSNSKPLTGQKSNPKSDILNLGYFPNVNHAQAIIGIGTGNFAKAIDNSRENGNFTIVPRVFSSSAAVVDALYSGQIDAAYVSPNSVIDSFILSGADDLRIISGVSSGGASFVVRNDSGIDSVSDLGGKKFASPQLGNTQDVALRKYLVDNGYNTIDNGGDITIVALKPADIITQFQVKDIDGAWVPEPIATILKDQTSGKILVDERDLWPDGKFVTGNIIVRTDYLRDNPDVIKKLLEAHVDETAWINGKLIRSNDTNMNDNNVSALVLAFNNGLKNLTGKSYSDIHLSEAMSRIDFTTDPLSNSLSKIADDTYEFGFIKKGANWNEDFSKLYDFTLLNEVLREKGLQTINS
ncbi:ABC transporter substrate-binding protein [Candidatus Nitrosocosmicus hydrocola]|uniref:ABC transporter substrate-binding protein n=1 Tax=Candidatus Nitrosocosmicus hydrocola TaxID=1826872 RepID=UPI000AD4233A|nr:ABC transporter substrate-binding protein [Candidatus Nitrosocosmicus hydrocola]